VCSVDISTMIVYINLPTPATVEDFDGAPGGRGLHVEERAQRTCCNAPEMNC
jgi:hypothetical protein